MAEQRFKFWCPVEISKAKDKDGKEVMRLGGIASTMDKDADGEFLDPSGFDISDFKKSGVVNWHHQAKNSPATIIGEPKKAEVRKDGFYVETDLYPTSDLAREVYELAEVLQKDSKTRRLGYSIEGSVIERDIQNPKIVKQAKITGLAITHMPKNAQTFADIIKGNDPCWDGYEMIGTKDKGGKKVPNCVKKDEEDEIDVKKTLDTSSGRATMPESVDGVKVAKMSEEKRYDTIFKSLPGISIEKAEQINNLLNKIEMAMAKGKEITDKDLEKAMSHLGIDPSESPLFEKAKKSFDKPDGDLALMKDEDEGEDEEKMDDETVQKAADDVAAAIDKEVYGGDGEGNPSAEDEDEDEETEKGKYCADDEADMEKDMKKGGSPELIKAISEFKEENVANVRALAQLVKASMDNTDLIKGKLFRTNKELRATRADLQKALDMVENLSGQSTGRKSITKGYTDKKFGGGDIIEKAGSGSAVLNTTEHKRAIINILDSACFNKGGYDEEFGKAVTSFEAGGKLDENVIARLKSEHNVNIVQ